MATFPAAFAGTSGPSPIPNPPDFQLSSSAVSLCKGQVNYVPITIVNKAYSDTQMTSTILSLVGSKGLSAFGNDTINAGNINANSTETLYMPILVSQNASSYVSFGIEINYYFFTFYSDSEIRNLSVSTHACPSPLSITVLPKILTSGGIQNISLNLTNTGNTTLSLVSLTSSAPSQDLALLTQPSLVNSINPKSSAHVNESIYLSKNASQLIPFNITGSFYNGNDLNLVSDNLFLFFGGMINLTSSSLTVSPAVPTAGSIFSLSFLITDVGTSKASAVTATAVVPKGFSTYGSNTIFVGDIAVDSQTPVTLSIIAGNTLKQGVYTIPVRINYLDSLRDNLSTWVNFTANIAPSSFNVSQFTVARRQTGTGFSLVTILLGVLALVFAVLFIRERRRRRAK